jgi:hypothetical protein
VPQARVALAVRTAKLAVLIQCEMPAAEAKGLLARQAGNLRGALGVG